MININIRLLNIPSPIFEKTDVRSNFVLLQPGRRGNYVHFSNALLVKELWNI
jgi:hypothetical protein